MYKSRFKKLKSITIPKYRFLPNSDRHNFTRVLMLPIKLEDIETLPNDLAHYEQTVKELIEISPVKEGVAYLTIEENLVIKGKSLRTRGLHVDGIGSDGKSSYGIWAATGIKNYISSMWNEGAERWYQGAAGIGGFITVSSPAGCRAWNKDFTGIINYNGSCEHLRGKLFPDSEATIFESGVAYWCNATCVHESMPMEEDTTRTFVRLSMPSDAPWYAGYTKNPKGVLPTGIIVQANGYGRVGEPEVILKG